MIYLDSAATSFQKPEGVGRAMQKAMNHLSSPGRGGYREAMEAAELALECRMELADFFHASSPEQVVFTMNATHGLNIAVKSLVHPGDRVAISGYEHNAVTRPLHAIGDVEVTVASSPLFQPEETVAAFMKALEAGCQVAICNHVSNVFGFAQPVEQIAAACQERGIPFILDASQSAGILPIDMAALGAAFIALPGHKGLYGPQGTGVLLCGENTPTEPLMQGGTGSASLEQDMPAFLPDRLEAGTHNMPGIAGLLEGVRFVRERGIGAICTHERQLAALAAEGLRNLPGVRVFAQRDLYAQTGVVSFLCEGVDVETVGEALARRQIAVRTGLHCAPLAHKSAGTVESGTVRASFSAFNTRVETIAFVETMRQILQENLNIP